MTNRDLNLMTWAILAELAIERVHWMNHEERWYLCAHWLWMQDRTRQRIIAITAEDFK